MRTLSQFILIAALVCAVAAFTGALGNRIDEHQNTATHTTETSETSETTSAYLARVEAEAAAHAQEGAQWRVANPAPRVWPGEDTEEQVDPTDDEPRTSTSGTCFEDQSCWDAATMGNGEAGVGSAHGPRGGRCEAGGVLRVNEAGRTVCDYS